MNLEDHELASCWPLMREPELIKLSESIRKNGLRNPIKLFEGKILDGRNRNICCKRVGVAIRSEEFSGTWNDAKIYANDVNTERRHLTSGQRSIVAGKLARLKHGSNRFQKVDGPIELSTLSGSPSTLMSTKEAAEEAGTSTSTAKRGKWIVENASPETVAQVENGDLSPESAIAKTKKEKGIVIVTRQDHLEYRQAEKFYKAAIAHLDKIKKADVDRAHVLQKMIRYCKRRLELQN